MARISKDEHPRILRMVDSEHRKVAEVAAEYGCTPANIYALLGKLRRGDAATPAMTPGDTVSTDKQAATSTKEPVPIGGDQDAEAPSLPDLFTSKPHISTSPVEACGPGGARRRAAVATPPAAAAVLPETPAVDATIAAVPDVPQPVPPQVPPTILI